MIKKMLQVLNFAKGIIAGIKNTSRVLTTHEVMEMRMSFGIIFQKMQKEIVVILWNS